LIALYVLALLDGALCGFRAWAGRSARIKKFDYYARAMGYGIVGAQIASGIALLILALLVFQPAHASLIADLERGARGMLAIYIPFAAVILTCLALRAVPLVDVRSMTSVLVLGPLTGARPLVMGLGVLVAILRMSSLEAKLIAAAVLLLMFLTEFTLDRFADVRSRLE
jgi:hypothetical protein